MNKSITERSVSERILARNTPSESIHQHYLTAAREVSRTILSAGVESSELRPQQVLWKRSEIFDREYLVVTIAESRFARLVESERTATAWVHGEKEAVPVVLTTSSLTSRTDPTSKRALETGFVRVNQCLLEILPLRFPTQVSGRTMFDHFIQGLQLGLDTWHLLTALPLEEPPVDIGPVRGDPVFDHCMPYLEATLLGALEARVSRGMLGAFRRLIRSTLGKELSARELSILAPKDADFIAGSLYELAYTAAELHLWRPGTAPAELGGGEDSAAGSRWN